MKLLSIHQLIFTWLRIFPFSNGTDRITLRKSLAFSVTVLLVEVLSLASSIIYFFENVLNNPNYSGNSLYPIIQISGYGCTLYTLIVAYIKREEIRIMFDKIQQIYDGLYIQNTSGRRRYNQNLN